MKIAAVQGAPVFLDKTATTKKILAYMSEAAQNGADVVVFSETLLPGYPWWIYLPNMTRWEEPRFKEMYALYLENAVEADGPELRGICEHAKNLGVFVSLGIVERSGSGGSVYCTNVMIHPENGIVNLHRKVMPTFAERLTWATGDGAGLNVLSYKGFRIGALSCWENWMPLARFSMYEQGEEIHIATFPGLMELTEDITRFIALEGRCYCVTVGGVLRAEDIPDTVPLKADMIAAQDVYLNGGTYIVDPAGEQIHKVTEPVETIVYFEPEKRRVLEERQYFDPAGHYSRRDIFRFSVNKQRLDAPSEEDK